MSPLQGWVIFDSETQGFALGYWITPLWGFGSERGSAPDYLNPF
jgi:hypothetical protein